NVTHGEGEGFEQVLDRGCRDLDEQLELSASKQVREDRYDIEQLDSVVHNEPPKAKELRADAAGFINARATFFTRLLDFRKHNHAVARPGEQFSAGSAVLCHFFGRKAIYGSTLGANQHHVVRYFLVYSGPSRHQLGRLTMTLHHCGELRFASLFDAPA